MGLGDYIPKRATKRARQSKRATRANPNVKRATSTKPRLGRNTVAVYAPRWDHLRAELAKPSRVRVGVLASRGGNAKHQDSELSLLDIAHVHEFGSPAANVPERSFIRRTFSLVGGRGAAWLPGFTTKLAKGVLEGKLGMETALHILGQRGVAEVRRTVTEGAGVPPPLKPATIAAKGSTRPLVDTAQMINAVSYELAGDEVALDTGVA